MKFPWFGLFGHLPYLCSSLGLEVFAEGPSTKRLSMIRKILFVLFLMVLGVRVMGQLQQMKGKTEYPFWLYLPADSIVKAKPPVLIFLHGRSLSGTDLELVKRYGVITEIVRGRKIPAIVFAPQVKPGQAWDPDKVLEVLNWVQKQYVTDSSRVYVVGMSLGGYGVLTFAGKYPDKVAGAVALCGGGNPSDGCRLATVPLWIQHGKLDQAVPISESEKMVNAIKACNGGVCLTYKVYDNWGHSQLARIFGEDSMYEWLFSQVKKKPN
jgi:predicted peptidase